MINKRLSRLRFFIIMSLMALAIPVIYFGTLQEKTKGTISNNRKEIVVIFNKAVNSRELHNITEQLPATVKVVNHIDDYALFSVESEKDNKKVLRYLKKNQNVKAAEENDMVINLGVSNDAYSDAQWAIDNTGHYSYLSKDGKVDRTSVPGVDMDVAKAWDIFPEKAPANKEVVIAVIDTGVDYNHPDLVQHMWMNKNEIAGDSIDNDNNGYVDDIYGWDFYNDDSTVCHYKYNSDYKLNLASPDDNDDHGTHIAGIIGAVANNNIGIAGVASNVNVKIMSLKINGGSKSTGSISSAIEAIKYATKMGADIANLSWGTSQYSETLQEIMRESDMLFVAAAGNSGTNNDNSPVYPASLKLDNLISVTFINPEGELALLSNYGPGSVDLAAPGGEILSTLVGTYGTMSGSSMAAPHVSAVAAMIYATNDNLYPANVKKIILDHIKPLSNLDGKMKHAGIPSAYNVLMATDQIDRDVNAPELTFTTNYNKNDFIVSIKAKDIGGSKTRIIKWIIGKRTLDDFQRGMEGNDVVDNQITVLKSGIYSFYAADYAGNETVTTYDIKDDTTSPLISASYIVDNDYRYRTVTVKLSDLQSGVKKAEYMEGKWKATDFLPSDSGAEIKITDGKGSFRVKKDSTYTIFASDYRGNLVAKQIVIKTVKATEIRLLRTVKTLYIGDEYMLRAYKTPENSTDMITYQSSNGKVASVTNSGKILANREGTAYITVRTASGKKTVCKIIVKK